MRTWFVDYFKKPPFDATIWLQRLIIMEALKIIEWENAFAFKNAEMFCSRNWMTIDNN